MLDPYRSFVAGERGIRILFLGQYLSIPSHRACATYYCNLSTELIFDFTGFDSIRGIITNDLK